MSSQKMPSTNISELQGASGPPGGQEVTVVAHCLLNPLKPVVKGPEPLAFSSAGPTVQLPIPEALYLRLERWAVTRNQLDVPGFHRFCHSLITHYADLLEMLAQQGARLRVVGVTGSPRLWR